jgi:hypothetical protein
MVSNYEKSVFKYIMRFYWERHVGASPKTNLRLKV